MKTNTFIPVDHVISEATSYNNMDRSFSQGFSKGWYRARVADALQEIALDSCYFDMIVDLPMPANLRLDMPEGIFNVKEVYVGDYSNGCCKAGSLQWVHWKRQFNNNGDSESYTAKVNDTGVVSDPILLSKKDTLGYTHTDVLFANEQNGLIQFSPSASGYSGVRLVGKGMGVKFGGDIFIPIFFERYCVDWVCHKFWLAKMGEGKVNALSMYDRFDVALNGRTGSWRKAKNRAVKSSGFIRESLKEFITNPILK